MIGYDNDTQFVNTGWRWTTQSNKVTPVTRLSDWMGSFQPAAISADGKAIVGGATSALNGNVCVKWTGGSTIAATVLGAGECKGTCGDGSVSIGYSSETDGGAEVFDASGQHTLKSLPGFTPELTSDWSLQATGIFSEGKVVIGNGSHGSHGEGWIAHLP